MDITGLLRDKIPVSSLLTEKIDVSALLDIIETGPDYAMSAAVSSLSVSIAPFMTTSELNGTSDRTSSAELPLLTESALAAVLSAASSITCSLNSLQELTGTVTNASAIICELNTSAGGGVERYPLDVISSSPNVWSTRLEDSNYSGYLIACERSADNVYVGVSPDSNDEISLDSSITYLGGGSTSAANLGQFLADSGYSDPDSLGSSATGKVRILYDQSSGAKDASQTTHANQPIIYESGALITENGHVVLKFDGVSTGLDLPDQTLGRFIMDRHQIMAVSGSAGMITHTGRTTSNTYEKIKFDAGNTMKIEFSWNRQDSSDTYTISNFHIADVYYDSTSYATTWYLNSSANGTGYANKRNSEKQNVSIGYNRAAANDYLNGKIGAIYSEYNADMTGDRSTITDSLKNWYGIS